LAAPTQGAEEPGDADAHPAPEATS
jgi:hypothetical protein